MGCCCSKEVAEDEEAKEVRTPLLSEQRAQSGERLSTSETASNPKYHALEDTSPDDVPKSAGSGDLEGPGTGPAPGAVTADVLSAHERSGEGPGDKRTKVAFEQAVLQAASDTAPKSSELIYPPTAEVPVPPQADPGLPEEQPRIQQSQREANELKNDPTEPTVDSGEPTKGQGTSSLASEEPIQRTAEPSTGDTEPPVEPGETPQEQKDTTAEPNQHLSGQDEPTAESSEPTAGPVGSRTEATAAAIEPAVAEHEMDSLDTDAELEKPVENEGLYNEQEQRYTDLQDAVRNLELMYPEDNLERTLRGCLTHVKHKCGNNVVLKTLESTFRLEFAEDQIDHSIIPALVEFNKASDMIQEVMSNEPHLSKSVAAAIDLGSKTSEQDSTPQGRDRYISKLNNIADALVKIREGATEIFKDMEKAVTIFEETSPTRGDPSQKLNESIGETKTINQNDDQAVLNQSTEGIEPPLEDKPPSLQASPDAAESIGIPVEETEQQPDGSQVPEDTDWQSRVTHIVQDDSDDHPGEDSSEDATEQQEQAESGPRGTQLEHDGPEVIQDPDNSFRTEESGELDMSAYTEDDSFHDTHDEDHLQQSPPVGTEDFLQSKQELPEFSVEHHNGHGIDDVPEQVRHGDETFETPKFNSTMFDGSASSPGDQSRVDDQSGSSPIGQSLLDPAGKDRLLSMVSSTGGYETAREDTFNLTEYQGFSESSADVSREETLSVADESNTTLDTTDASAHESWIQSPDSVVGGRV